MINYFSRENLLMPRPILLENMRGVAGGGTAHIDVPVGGPTYYEFHLRCLTAGGVELTEAQIQADVLGVRIDVDNESTIDVLETELQAVQNFYFAGLHGAGYIPIMLHRPYFEDLANQDATRYGTLDVDSLRISVTLAPVLAQLASIQVFAVATYNEPQPLGRHVVVRAAPRAWAGANEEIINDWNINVDGAPDYLLALHLNNANAGELRVRVAGQEVTRSPRSLFTQRYVSAARTVTAGWAVYDFQARNRFADTLPLNAKPFEVGVDWALGAPGAYRLIAETVRGNLRR